MATTDLAALREESIDLEALLLSRQYLYGLFHKLFGGTPDEDVLAAVLSDTTAEVVDEFTGDNASMQGLGRFLQDLRDCVDRSVLVDSARDEYTRLFIGPAALPAPVTESPYRSGDATEFQENTLEVRRLYREQGLQLMRLMRIPDDHVATLCGFMERLAGQAVADLRAGRVEALGQSLREQESFVNEHLVSWLDDFARATRRSKTTVLYPQMIEALAAFAANDATLLSEAALWAEGTAAEEPVVAGGLGAVPGSAEARAFAEVADALQALDRLRPYGIEDHELVEAAS